MAVQEKVDIVMSADTYAGKKLLEDMAAAFTKLEASGSKAGEKINQGFLTATFGAQRLLTLTRDASFVASSAMQLLTKNMDDFIARADRAARAQTGFADAHRKMANALGAGDAERVTNQLLSINRQTGVKMQTLGLAAEASLSARGPNLGADTAISVVREAAKYARGENTTEEELRALSMGAMTLIKDDPTLDPERAMAWAATAMGPARAASRESFATYTLPNLTQARAFGQGKDSIKWLASRQFAFGQSADDPQDRRNSTNFITTLKQMAVEAAKSGGLPANSSMGDVESFLFNTPEGLKIRQEWFGPLLGADANKLGALTPENEALAKRLMGSDVNFKGEARLFPTMLQYFQGPESNNKTWQLIRGMEREIPDTHDPNLVTEYRRRQATINQSPFQSTAVLDQELGAISSRPLLGNTRDATIATVNKRVDDVLQSTGRGWLGRNIAWAEMQLQNTTANTGEEVLGNAATVVDRMIPRNPFDGGRVTKGQEGLAQVLTELRDELIEQRLQRKQGQMLEIKSGDEMHRGAIGADGAGR